MDSGTIDAATVRQPGVDYRPLVDRWVHIRGNAGAIFNANRQLIGARLFFPGLEAVTAIGPSPGNTFDRPVQPVSSLLQFNPASSSPHHVHVRGAVTLYWPGRTVCIRNSTDGLCAETSQNSAVAAGSVIDLAGFTTLNGFKPALEDAVFQSFPGNGSTAASPIAITPEQAMQGDRDSELVSIDGRLIGRDQAASDPTLILSSGKFVFRVFLPHDLADAAVYASPSEARCASPASAPFRSMPRKPSKATDSRRSPTSPSSCVPLMMSSSCRRPHGGPLPASAWCCSSPSPSPPPDSFG
jgi:hypothetical protein